MTTEEDKRLADAIRLGTTNLKEWQSYGRLWKSRYDEMIATCLHTGKQRDAAQKRVEELEADANARRGNHSEKVLDMVRMRAREERTEQKAAATPQSENMHAYAANRLESVLLALGLSLPNAEVRHGAKDADLD